MTRILFALLLGATVVHAADQTILGTEFVVKDRGAKQKVTGKAKEKASSNTLVGDPTVDGATLTVRAHGATSTEQTFPLPQGTNAKGKPFWTGSSTSGFKYKDSKGENSAVAQAAIKKNEKGVFTIAFNASNLVGTAPGGPGIQPVDVVPPNPGDSGCVLLQLTGGDSYSVRFGPGDGKVTNKSYGLDKVKAGLGLFKVSKPADEGTCVIAATTSTIATTASNTTSTGR